MYPDAHTLTRTPAGKSRLARPSTSICRDEDRTVQRGARAGGQDVLIDRGVDSATMVCLQHKHDLSERCCEPHVIGASCDTHAANCDCCWGCDVSVESSFPTVCIRIRWIRAWSTGLRLQRYAEVSPSSTDQVSWPRGPGVTAIHPADNDPQRFNCSNNQRTWLRVLRTRAECLCPHCRLSRPIAA